MAFKQALPVYIPEEQPKSKIYRQTKKEKKQIKIESKIQLNNHYLTL